MSNVGLQRRIIIFVIVGLIIIFSIFAFFISKVFQQSVELVYSERLALARNIAATIDNDIAYSVGEMEKMSFLASPALKKSISEPREKIPQNSGGCLTMCHDRATVKVSRVSIADDTGRILSIEPHTSELSSSNLSIEEIARKALLKGTTVVEDFQPEVNPETTLAIVTPLKNEKGVITGTLNLEFNPFSSIHSFSSLVSSMGISYGVEIWNTQGKIIFNTGLETPDENKHSLLIQPFLGKKIGGTVLHEDENSEYGGHVIAVAPLNTFPAYVILEQEKDIAFLLPNALREKLLLSSAIILFIFTGATIFLAWITTKRVVKPILSLAASSQKIAAGELDQPISTIGEDEVALLARNFEDMRAKLKASREEIEAWNKELEQRVQHRTKELSALFQASQTLASSLELDTVLESIMGIAKNIFPQADAGILYINDEDRHSLVIKSSFGFNSNIQSLMIPQNGNDCASEAFHDGKPSLCRPVHIAPELHNTLSGDRSTYIKDMPGEAFEAQEGICVPLITEKVTTGVISLYNLKNENSFSQSDVQLLQSLANQAAIAIENAKLFKEASMVGMLRELDRMKTEFVARASHELRTPTTSIKGFAETLLREDLSLPASEQREFLEGINSAADRLARIITDLLTVSRIESGKLAVEKVATSLLPVIQKVVEEFQNQARNRVILVEISSGLPLVWADPDRLEDVMDNLISNAIKYSPPDKPIKIQAALQAGQELINQRLTHPFSDNSSFISVSVTDEGIGITPENFSKLFQRFERIEGALGKGIGGVGLGLYICKVYIEAMGGTIWVESSPGKGSTFSFSLLAAGKDEKKAAILSMPAEHRNRGTLIKEVHSERILVVDDEADVIKTIQINLKAHGFDILTAFSGNECLAMAAQQKPDAIILDIIMPGISGLEVARQLRENPATQNIPVIFLTARAQEADETEAQKVGVAAYIKKPFSTRHLYETVTAMLKKAAVTKT